MTLIIVGTITMGVAIEAYRLRIGIPVTNSTQIADFARVAAPAPLFAAFQLVTALLLLSAASSSFQAGPGLLKALARHHTGSGQTAGILPAPLGTTNSNHTPYWGAALFVIIAAAVTAAAGGNEQELVPFYAVSVFLSFLAGLLATDLFSYRERRYAPLTLNLVGAVVVAVHPRGEPVPRHPNHQPHRRPTHRRRAVSHVGQERTAPGHTEPRRRARIHRKRPTASCQMMSKLTTVASSAGQHHVNCALLRGGRVYQMNSGSGPAFI